MKLTRKITSIVVGMSLAAVSSLSLAGTAVIVHPSNGDTLSEDDIQRLFLGKTKNFPGGGQAIPINQDEGKAARDAFNDKVVGKSASQLKAYWSKLVFTGKGTPPKDVGGDADVKALIAENPNMIGYVDESAVDDSVKVVYSMP